MLFFIKIVLIYLSIIYLAPLEGIIVLTSTTPSGVSQNQQISSTSLNNAAVAGAPGLFIIQKTGSYFFTNDVVANPTNNDMAIIYVQASEVSIDLGGKTLSLSSSSNNKNIVGIKVAPQMKNVSIFNGSIIGFSSTTGSPQGALTEGIVADSVTNLVVQNLLVSGCSEFGIDCSNCYNIQMFNVSTQGVSGIVGGDVNVCGASFVSCFDSSISSGAFDFTNTPSGSSAHAYGIKLTNCANFSLSKVSASNSQTQGSGNAYGVFMDKSFACFFDNVSSVANNTANPLGNQIATGIFLNTSSGNVFTSCNTSCQINRAANLVFDDNGNNYVITSSAYGMRLTNSSNSNQFTNCVSSNSLGGFTARGFSIESCYANNFDKCIASGNKGGRQGLVFPKDNSGGYPVIALGATAYGFYSEFGSGNFFTNCQGCRNSGYLEQGYYNAYDVLTTFSAGDLARIATQQASGLSFRTESSSSVSNSFFSANSAGTAGTVFGINFQGSCSRCSLSYNEMLANIGLFTYGFKDFSANCSTLLRGNVAFGHGACFSGGQSSLIDSGSMNYMMEFGGYPGSMNIQMIIKEGDIANMNAFEAGSTQWYNFSILDRAISG